MKKTALFDTLILQSEMKRQREGGSEPHAAREPGAHFVSKKKRERGIYDAGQQGLDRAKTK